MAYLNEYMVTLQYDEGTSTETTIFNYDDLGPFRRLFPVPEPWSSLLIVVGICAAYLVACARELRILAHNVTFRSSGSAY